MKRFYVLFTVLLLLSMFVAACQPAVVPEEPPAVVEPEQPEPEPEVEAEVEEPVEVVPIGADAQIALVPAGRVGTEGFMFLSGQGYKEAAADFGFAEMILESEVPEEWERNVRTAAQDGAELIVGVGSTMKDAIANVAPEFPDTQFALVDDYPGGDNTAGLISQEQEGTFLAGALAAMMTTRTEVEGINEAKVIGFIGGMDIPVIHRALGGIEQGAEYIDPEVRVEVAYVGSFRDPAKAKELALSMIENQQVDIIFSMAGSFGDAGTFEAVAEKGVYGIGMDVNWDEQVPGFILTSVLKRTDRAVYDVIERFLMGEFEAGEIKYGLASGVMDITDMSVIGDKVSDDVRDKLAEIKEDIINGVIVVERRN